MVYRAPVDPLRALVQLSCVGSAPAASCHQGRLATETGQSKGGTRPVVIAVVAVERSLSPRITVAAYHIDCGTRAAECGSVNMLLQAKGIQQLAESPFGGAHIDIDVAGDDDKSAVSRRNRLQLLLQVVQVGRDTPAVTLVH